MPQGKKNGVCDPVCDFCRFYDFNPDVEGRYTGDGMCRHPDHPGPSEPYDGCPDFECSMCEVAHGA